MIDSKPSTTLIIIPSASYNPFYLYHSTARLFGRTHALFQRKTRFSLLEKGFQTELELYILNTLSPINRHWINKVTTNWLYFVLILLNYRFGSNIAFSIERWVEDIRDISITMRSYDMHDSLKLICQSAFAQTLSQVFDILIIVLIWRSFSPSLNFFERFNQALISFHSPVISSYWSACSSHSE